jgi:hypothetical protein
VRDEERCGHGGSGVQRRAHLKSTSADSGGPAEGEREDTRSDRLAFVCCRLFTPRAIIALTSKIDASDRDKHSAAAN